MDPDLTNLPAAEKTETATPTLTEASERVKGLQQFKQGLGGGRRKKSSTDPCSSTRKEIITAKVRSLLRDETNFPGDQSGADIVSWWSQSGVR